MSSIVLCNLSDAVSVIAEEREQWTLGVLASLGVSEDLVGAANIDEFREGMEQLGIEVIESSAGKINIYKKVWHDGESEELSGWLPATDKNLVAQWDEPKYIKKIEGKDVYYEIHLNEWSILKTRR
jgi:hypothetical protein